MPGYEMAADGGTAARGASEERAVFERDGVVRWGEVLTPEQLIRLRESVERAFYATGRLAEGARDLSEREGNPIDEAILHKINLWEAERACEEQVRRPDLVARVEALLGGPVRLFRDHSFYKAPGKGDRSRMVLHQDNRYWHIDPADAVTVWMALDDATVDNGCVHYIPGSHRWDRVRYERPEEGSVMIEAQTEREPVAYPVPAGHALVHSVDTLHGSGPNRTTAPRRAYVLVFVRDGATLRGEPMTGFPLAADLAGPAA